jgi:hypothetical protein
MRLIVAAAALGLFGQAALAFEETTVGGEKKTPAAPALELPKVKIVPGKDLDLSARELHLGKTPGTEVHVPGIGKIGVLPQLDLALEILHGANEPEKGTVQDKTNSDDVQLRGTVKYRF